MWVLIYKWGYKKATSRVLFMVKHWALKKLDINYQRKLPIIDCCWCCWLLLLLSKQVTVSNSSKQFQTKCLKVYEWLMSLYFRTMKKYWNDNIFWALLLLIFLLWLNVTLTFFSTLTANMAICIVNISACNAIFLSPLYFLIIFEVWIWLNLLFPCQL